MSRWYNFGAMRVYHFVNKKFGLDDLRKNRLKIARIVELNDPFEFAALDLSDGEFRQAMGSMKQSMSGDFGILCFSKSWRNPVQWAHYADKHTGLCLGFDVPDELLMQVKYRKRRLSSKKLVARKKAQLAKIEAEMDTYLGNAGSREEFEARKGEFIQTIQGRNRDGKYSDPTDQEIMVRNLSAKFFDWSYEQEYRFFVSFTSAMVKEVDGMYFFGFSEQLKLTEVIVGVRSSVTRKEIEAAIGKTTACVDIFNVRESYSEFAVVKGESGDF